MTLALQKEIDNLLSELPEDYEPDNYIITIDNDPTTFGSYEVLDGNHRLAMLQKSNSIKDAEIYQIDSQILFDAGFMNEDDDQNEFENFVVNNGEKIDNSLIENIEIL